MIRFDQLRQHVLGFCYIVFHTFLCIPHTFPCSYTALLSTKDQVQFKRDLPEPPFFNMEICDMSGNLCHFSTVRKISRTILGSFISCLRAQKNISLQSQTTALGCPNKRSQGQSLLCSSASVTDLNTSPGSTIARKIRLLLSERIFSQFLINQGILIT